MVERGGDRFHQLVGAREGDPEGRHHHEQLRLAQRSAPLAAFLAAEHDTSVGMVHLLHATRREYQKMGRLIDGRLFVWQEPDEESDNPLY